MVLIKDRRPTLIDAGFGSETEETVRLIRDAGVEPAHLDMIVNTHFHSDHIGGNCHFQNEYGVPIAAHKWEADLVNVRHPEVCSAEWLDQPVEPYSVDRRLSDGDEIHTGSRTFQVLFTPGHSSGHISLYEPDEKVLIAGDLFHKHDLGWLNMYREGVTALHRALESLDRVATLPIRVAYSGHGPAMDNPGAAIDGARRRLEKWLIAPEKLAWHGCKRIFSFALMIRNGLEKEKVERYLLSCPWFHDYARHSFRLEPEAFVHALVDEMIRSGAADWHSDRLIAATPHQLTSASWFEENNIRPGDWPASELSFRK
ncbi:MBL fold metallo-hydrolase [Alteribacter lacisalsi]|uniref:MBL fold metallo-hydrolase n=2 Tax=Alteribacter lacisalsi TaxID=2045244 RepID=A0A2W0H5B3_9BACI|nr:MBL fold metallo-hydrolase [Alteribacter lacisalsi]